MDRLQPVSWTNLTHLQQKNTGFYLLQCSNLHFILGLTAFLVGVPRHLTCRQAGQAVRYKSSSRPKA